MKKTGEMFSEDDLMMISGLQHLAFCERQWALIHLEQAWLENRFTAEGQNLHEKVHHEPGESRGLIRITRGLKIRSLRLGLIGQADVVEFHLLPGIDQSGESASDPLAGEGEPRLREGVVLARKKGTWKPFPVEYKRGKPKIESCDLIQLCAQALCLEEMLQVNIPAGALFYGQPQRRLEVEFSGELREKVETMAARMQALRNEKTLPAGRLDQKCSSCSLQDECLPKMMKKSRSARDYVNSALVDLGSGSI